MPALVTRKDIITVISDEIATAEGNYHPLLLGADSSSSETSLYILARLTKGVVCPPYACVGDVSNANVVRIHFVFILDVEGTWDHTVPRKGADAVQ